MTLAVVVLTLLCGTGLLITALISHRADQDRAIAEVLGLVRAAAERDHDEPLANVTGLAVDLAGQAVAHVDRERSLGNLLDRARIPLRPGEFVIVVGAAVLGLAAVTQWATGSALLAVAAGILAILLTAQRLRRRVNKRRRAFEAQLPDALSLVASSLAAGHTFLRAVQMMCEESEPPMADEFGRLIAETRLGDPVTQALERMAARLQIRDMDMVVQAIRIQQTVGGKLADLLHTLADVIRSRDEVRREVLVLTAEGRMSAYVLAALVPLLFLTMQVLNPAYIVPLYHGTGLFILIGCAMSVVAGMLTILRMVKIDV